MAWSEREALDRIKEICTAEDYDFLGFVGEWVGVKTKLRLLCRKHASVIWESTNFSNFVNQKTRCPSCSYEKRGKSKSKNEDHYVRIFMSTGSFPENTKFKRLDNKFWQVSCPVCKEDELSKAGFKSEFICSYSNLFSGNKPCRCGQHHREKEETEFLINKVCSESDQEISFVKFCDTLYKHASKVTIKCNKHGSWDTSIGSFLNSGHRCPGCTSSGFKAIEGIPAYLYVIKVHGRSLDFIGFGITKNLNKRLKEHKSNLKKVNLDLEEIAVFEFDSLVIRKIETAITKEFEVGITDIIGFKRESMAYSNLEKLITFINQIKQGNNYD